MGGRPPKSHIQLVTEKKSHRSKAELKIREKAEKDLLTGGAFKEWPDVKAHPVAHKEFARLKKLFKIIKKDDALHEGVINRYCLLLAECKDLDDLRLGFMEDIKTLGEKYQSGVVEFAEYITVKGDLQDRVLACDRKVMDKRKMMLSIERENLMTIASALRAIPKKAEEKKESPMAEFLKRKAGGNGASQ